MIGAGRSGYLYPCCLKSEHSHEPCWVGSHVTKWTEFSTKEIQHFCDVPDNENYWSDRDIALEWRKFSAKGV
eukprot:10223868-Ditylum_brightwellii.AAC.1